jgi:hypothetical protein
MDFSELLSYISIMKAISFLLLALAAASASACANYQYCNCLDADGQQNDKVTQTVCNEYKEASTVAGPGSGHLKCTSPNNVQIRLNNCEWRKECWNKGATGSDSSCRSKLG